MKTNTTGSAGDAPRWLSLLATLALSCGHVTCVSCSSPTDAKQFGDGGSKPPPGSLGAIKCPVGPPVAAGTGRTFHVCDCDTGSAPGCKPGNDGNPGTAADAPWRSYEKARQQFGELAAGDTIAFCRGGVVGVSGDGRRWHNNKCKASQPCIFRDYAAPWGTGKEGRPVILDKTGGHGFSLEDGGEANHEEGYVFTNLELRGRGMDSGFFFFNDVDDVLLDNLVISGFGVGAYVGLSNKPDPDSDGKNSRITLRNSLIRDNSGQGFLGAGDETAVECNTFENNGFGAATFNHNLYISADIPVRNVRVRGNQLYRSAMIDGKCEGVSLVVHGSIDGLLIEGNLVREDVGAAGAGCWGIAVDSGYESGETFKDVVIKGNRVLNTGNVGIGLNACVNCVVENNVVVQEQAIETIGIVAPNRRRNDNDAMLKNLIVRNNSVLIGAASGGGPTGISVGGEGTGHVVVNNAVVYQGDAREWSCFDLGLEAGSYQAVDHNVCSFAQAGRGEWNRRKGDLAAWQAASMFDKASLSVDPLFKAPGAPMYDLSPDTGSPLVDSGHRMLSPVTDIDGKERGKPPDIGAFER